MEAILFYGDQDEATRRQVRSVAAQYSHRIGPRKRKKSRLPKQTGVIESKRGHYKKLAATAPEVDATSSKVNQGQTRFKVLDPQSTAHGDLQSIPEQQGGRAQSLRRELSDTETCAASSEVGSEPTHSPHTPQLGFPPAQGVTHSPDRIQSTCRMLPAYTWTEYPRYAVAQLGSPTSSYALSSVAPANRLAFELPNPTTCLGGPGHTNNAKQTAPTSHPMETPMGTLQPHAQSLHADQFLSTQRTPLPNVTREASSSDKGSTRPPLHILRCATEEDAALGDDTSRWRSGSEYFSAEESSPLHSPG